MKTSNVRAASSHRQAATVNATCLFVEDVIKISGGDLCQGEVRYDKDPRCIPWVWDNGGPAQSHDTDIVTLQPYPISPEEDRRRCIELVKAAWNPKYALNRPPEHGDLSRAVILSHLVMIEEVLGFLSEYNLLVHPSVAMPQPCENMQVERDRLVFLKGEPGEFFVRIVMDDLAPMDAAYLTAPPEFLGVRAVLADDRSCVGHAVISDSAISRIELGTSEDSLKGTASQKVAKLTEEKPMARQPKDQAEAYQWNRYFYESNPVIAYAADLLAAITVSGLRTHGSETPRYRQGGRGEILSQAPGVATGPEHRLWTVAFAAARDVIVMGRCFVMYDSNGFAMLNPSACDENEDGTITLRSGFHPTLQPGPLPEVYMLWLTVPGQDRLRPAPTLIDPLLGLLLRQFELSERAKTEAVPLFRGYVAPNFPSGETHWTDYTQDDPEEQRRIDGELANIHKAIKVELCRAAKAFLVAKVHELRHKISHWIQTKVTLEEEISFDEIPSTDEIDEELERVLG